MQAPFAVLDSPEVVSGLTHPLRSRVLAAFREPQTAASVARRLGAPRQQVGYHVRTLQEQGLLTQVAQRRAGNFVAQVLQSSAAAYAISSRALGPVALDPADVSDRFSSTYLAACCGRTLDEVGALREAADRAGKRLPTLTVEAEVRFADPARQAEFAEALQNAVTALVVRFHDDAAPQGRTFRLLTYAYPKPSPTPGTEKKTHP